MDDFLNDLMKELNDKEGVFNKMLNSLSAYIPELRAANFEKEVIDDFIFKALFFIYIKHYKLGDFLGIKEEGI